MLSEILADAFRKSTYTNVKEWRDRTDCRLSTETVSKVLLRGVEPGIPTFVTMAYHLGITPAEIAEACKAAGDTVFWKLIKPTTMKASEEEMLTLAKELPDDKFKAVIEFIKAMSKNHGK